MMKPTESVQHSEWHSRVEVPHIVDPGRSMQHRPLARGVVISQRNSWE